MSFTHISATDTLRLVDASVHGAMLAKDLAPGHIEMDLDDVTRVEVDHRRALLSLIEDDARDRGDLETANRAHYEHLRLNSRRLSGPPRVLDVVVYRVVLGYLVRPAYPALILVGVVLAITGYRWVRRLPVPDRERATALPQRDVTCFLDQLQAAVGRTLSPKLRGTAHGLGVLSAWGEYLGTKLLLAGVALGLANSNETLRQLVEAIR